MKHLIRLFLYARPQWGKIAIGLTGAIVEMMLALMVPLYTKRVIDRLVAPDLVAEVAYGFLNVVALGLLVFGAFRAGAIFSQIYLEEKASQEVAYRLRNDLYEKLQRLPFSYYDRMATGELMSRLTSDVEMCRQAMGFGLGTLGGNLVFLIGIVGYLLCINWRFTIVALALLPCLMLVAIRYARKVEPIFASIQQQVARLTAVAQENISGVRVVRAFSQEDAEINRFMGENEGLLTRNLKAAKTNAYYHPAMDFIANLSTVVVLWYGGREVVLGRITLGAMVAFNGYLMLLIWPVRMTGFLLGVMQRAVASAKRVFEILDQETSINEKPGAITLPRVEGYVCFENVSFAYEGGDTVLRNLSFVVRPGETVAIVGATGSGKSTLIHLLSRFYDVTEGRITIDGYDVRDVTLESLRRQIGMVLQENFLFSTTIRENIAYGRPDASQEEIEAAARAAAAHSFIVQLPQGYDTVVGERGVGLSGGQRQRIAIARALLADPRVLVLDDSTSSVDVETEREIQAALARLMEGRTTFIIAQRLTTVQRADQILVLDNGEIVQKGTHAELSREGGVYQRILRSQLLPADSVAERLDEAASMGGGA